MLTQRSSNVLDSEIRQQENLMSEVVLRDVFQDAWCHKNVFEEVQQITGHVVRNKEGRKTLRFEFQGSAYYLKLHQGVGWGEILKNLSQLKTPVIGASNEWLAINRFTELGIDTLTAVAFGKTGINPAQQLSFLITKELTGTLHLASYCQNWVAIRPAYPLKRSLIRKIAQTAKTMHDAGINHRDFYLCHFLLDVSKGLDAVAPDSLKFHVVDLHRAQMRKAVPLRWRVKDIASLYFSAMDIGLTKTDWLYFIEIYTGRSARQELVENSVFWRLVRKRAEQLYLRDWKRPAPPFEL